MFENEASLNHNTENEKPRSSGLTWAVIVLGAGLVVSLGAIIFEHSDLVNLRMDVAASQREMSALRQTVANGDQNVLHSVEALRADLELSRKEAASTTAQTREAARKQAEAIASKLTTTLAARQEEGHKQLAQELDQVRARSEQANAQATAKLTDITTEVSTVKTDVASTRSQLEKTISDLHRTTGDLGVMSGLIATNSKELAALKELGERDYFEFTLSKAGGLQRVGDVQVQLKKADIKRNRFTLEVVAEDKRVEKKDRGINEPVQFYVASKARQPYELVVNDVRKDQVVGYLATPKVKTPGRRL